MIDSNTLEKIKKRCGFDNGVCISSVGRSGGMGFWWRDISVNTISYSSHHFAADVLDNCGIEIWRAIGIYGWPDMGNKYKTWERMKSLKHSCESSCIMFGDFNEVISVNEKEGGENRREAFMDAFRETIDYCGLVDLGYKGSIFTWKRGKSKETVIRERLDRAMADDAWCTLFPNFAVRHLIRYELDHTHIVIEASKYLDRGKRGKLFHFESFWLSRDDCEEVVADAWSGSIGADPHERISACAASLSKWASTTFGNLKTKIRKTEKLLQEAQGGQVDSQMLERCENLVGELNELHRLEESYWFARARVNEMKDGDKNATYFHRKASYRQKRNNIDGLFDSTGVWKNDEDSTRHIIASYFHDLFASDSPSDLDVATAGLEDIVTNDMNCALDREPTREEIREALFQMHPNKAPGPDELVEGIS